ncbi:hypothetical protein [Rhodococcus tibetensis]|uniref:Excreted virulence factor EspC, type VII ESX diderm n=1 Tax=Rhodococcus tibetensis TaxID=2965064 RepID=A0ABT1QKS0_9NOCA|nr:hypothetical protein [Rhodococcus sp. FXJ9.536]MCQ4121660.1 hypothetical protein [Rhodococcus sp. FXJ9.536]
MGTLKADLDELERLGAVLHGLAEEAGTLRVGPAAGPFMSSPGGVMSSVLEACSITGDLIEGSLVPALEERLAETGDVMIYVAQEYRNQDDASADQFVAAYTDATGDWNAEG